MHATERARLAIVGGGFCAAVGSVFAALMVAFVNVIRFWREPEDMRNVIAAFPMVVIFSAIAAAPFGFIVGSIGSWWLVPHWAKTNSSNRVYWESGGLGALLGATYPLIAESFGWGPFENLVAALPISIGSGILCGVALAAFMRTKVLRRNAQLPIS
jgi:hypothetical protein